MDRLAIRDHAPNQIQRIFRSEKRCPPGKIPPNTVAGGKPLPERLHGGALSSFGTAGREN
jgi:hypothetical protein